MKLQRNMKDFKGGGENAGVSLDVKCAIDLKHPPYFPPFFPQHTQLGGIDSRGESSMRSIIKSQW